MVEGQALLAQTGVEGGEALEPAGGTPQQFAAMTYADRAKWKKIITDRKLTME